MGSTVIPGVGYDGADTGKVVNPTSQIATIYGTGPIKILKGDMIVLEGLEVDQNSIEFIAERSWAFWVDKCPIVRSADATYAHV
mgnify:FL=1